MESWKGPQLATNVFTHGPQQVGGPSAEFFLLSPKRGEGSQCQQEGPSRGQGACKTPVLSTQPLCLPSCAGEKPSSKAQGLKLPVHTCTRAYTHTHQFLVPWTEDGKARSIEPLWCWRKEKFRIKLGCLRSKGFLLPDWVRPGDTQYVLRHWAPLFLI